MKTDVERLARIRKRSLSNLIEVICEEIVKQALHSGELDDSVRVGVARHEDVAAPSELRSPKKEET